MTDVDVADLATFEALWKKVLSDFEGDAHGKFVHHAQRANLLPEAAKRYRLFKEQVADDESLDEGDRRAKLETIDKRLGGIAILAMAQLDASKTDPTPSKAARFFTFVIAAFLLAVIIGLVWALQL